MEGENGIVAGDGLGCVGHGEFPHHGLQPLLGDEDVYFLDLGDAFKGDLLGEAGLDRRGRRGVAVCTAAAAAAAAGGDTVVEMWTELFEDVDEVDEAVGEDWIV